MNLHKTVFTLTLLIFIGFSNISEANVIVLNGLTHIHDTEKGTTVTGEIILKNIHQEKEQRFIVSLKDLWQDCKGITHYLDINESERSLGKWISFNVTEKILKPKEKYVLTYTITIPKEFDLSRIKNGSFWSIVMIEIAEPIKESYEQGVKINSKIRYGIQLITNIGERENTEIEFANVDISKNKNKYDINVKLQNKGVFMVQPTLVLEVFDESGGSVKKIEATFKKLYPDSCKDFKISFSDLPPGVYDGVLVADYGGDMYGVNITIDVTEE